MKLRKLWVFFLKLFTFDYNYSVILKWVPVFKGELTCSPPLNTGTHFNMTE